MSDPIEFWFDFSSPYGYLAAHTIERRLAPYGRAVAWRPFLLGVAFKITGMTGLSLTPLRGDYAQRDCERISRMLGVPFVLPPCHPYRSQPVARAFYHLKAREPAVAVPFAKAAFDAHFAHGADLSSAEAVLALARPLVSDPEALSAWLASSEAKAQLAAVNEEAIGKGVFGSPFFIADGEPFWGWDRIGMLEQWLRNGSRWPEANA
jgi:2-hydroxychromene-2-carboxylate isomerase